MAQAPTFNDHWGLYPSLAALNAATLGNPALTPGDTAVVLADAYQFDGSAWQQVTAEVAAAPVLGPAVNTQSSTGSAQLSSDTGSGETSVTLSNAASGFTAQLTANNVRPRLASSQSGYAAPLELDIADLVVGGTAGTSGQVLTSNGPGANPTWESPGYVSGTIAANEVAFGTAPDTIGGSANFTWDNATSALAVIGDAADCLTVASLIDGQFLAVSPTSYTLTITDPLTPTNSATMGPGDVAVGDGTASGNVQAGFLGVTENGTGNRITLTAPGGLGTLTSENSATFVPTPLNVVCEELRVNGAPGSAGEVLTSNGPGLAPTWQAGGGGGGGAVYAGSLTVYVDGTNGTDAPGGGTLDAPYASINYAYSQVTSLGNIGNVSYNAQVGQYITEKLIFRIAPGRYSENVTLGFKRARVQLIGDGVQIIGNVTMLVNRSDFPAASMEAIKTSFPTPWTGVSAQNTFEITGEAGGGVESDASAVPLIVTGVSSVVFNDAAVPGVIASGTAWENNYGQFYFYTNKSNLIGGMVVSTAYVSTPVRAFPASVIEIDSSTVGEGSSPIRTYLGAVPYGYVTGTTWFTGTGVATGTQSATTLQDTTKAWVVNEWAGSTVTITSGTGVSQSRTVVSNTSNTLTVSGGSWSPIPVAGSSVYSLIGTAGQVGEGTITLKVHNSTIGAAIGARLTLGEIDGCRLYDIDRTMLGTVSNGSVTGSLSSSYLGMVVNQFRQFSGSGIAPSQYQIGSTSTTRFKIDSTSYTTLLFNRSSSTGALTARTLNLSGTTGTAASGGAATLTVAGTPWTANQYSNSTVTLTGGTGSGQTRTISSNTTNTLTVSVAWTTPPDATTTFTITTAQFDFQDDARGLNYTPTITANWAAPAPATVQAALERMASAIFILRGSIAIP